MSLSRALDKAIAAENADPKGLPAEDLAALAATPRRTYRLITIADAPFGTFPPYSAGGPSKVTTGEYGTSQSYLDPVFSSPSVVAASDRKVTVHASRRVPGVSLADPGAYEKHPIDGTKYDSREDADRATYEAGLTAYMVYDDSPFADLVPRKEV